MCTVTNPSYRHLDEPGALSVAAGANSLYLNDLYSFNLGGISDPPVSVRKLPTEDWIGFSQLIEKLKPLLFSNGVSLSFNPKLLRRNSDLEDLQTAGQTRI